VSCDQDWQDRERAALANTLLDYGCAERRETSVRTFLAFTHLANNVTRLEVPKGLDELRHRTIKVSFQIEVITILSVDIRQGDVVHTLGFGHTNGQDE
jgi:hypothetical protein